MRIRGRRTPNRRLRITALVAVASSVTASILGADLRASAHPVAPSPSVATGGASSAPTPLALPTSRTPAAVTTPTPPAGLRRQAVGAARQLIVVTSASWSSTWGTLRTYRRGTDGRWQVALPPMAARLGSRGFVLGTKRIQSTGTTPAGSYALTTAFGGLPDPGTRLRYTTVTWRHWWPYDPRDPSTYNVMQTSRSPLARWRTHRAEHLSTLAPTQYRYAVVIGFNMPGATRVDARTGQRVAVRPANVTRGGGIFLHVMHPRRPTAGCVAVSLSQMRALLRWLDPRQSPRIVMGPVGVVRSL